MNRISRYMRILIQNPNIFLKKTLGRILTGIIPAPKEARHVRIGRYTIEMFPSRNYWWKSMYFGYCGVEIARNIRKYLKKGGVFIDIGAGVGYFSAIGADAVGTSGRVHCFEPFPPNAEIIRTMVKSNPEPNIILNNCALGDADSVRDFYLDKANSCSMLKRFLDNVDKTIKVPTYRLDSYLKEKNIDNVSLIKIDVEGYEYFVLKGLAGFFKRTMCKPPIICEIGMPAYKKSGVSISEFDALMKGYGYRACSIFNPRITIDMTGLNETADVIFMPADDGV